MSGFLSHFRSRAGLGDSDAAHFDSWASSYDRDPARFFFRWMHGRILGGLRARKLPAGIVLDLGCGTGELLARARRDLDGRVSVGIDRSQPMIAVAARKPASRRAVVASANALPLRDGCAGLVMTTVSFHHWEDQGRALTEVARVLAPGGSLLMADFFAAGPLEGLVTRRGHTHGAGFRSIPQLKALLTQAGLRLDGLSRVGPPASPLRLVAATA